MKSQKIKKFSNHCTHYYVVAAFFRNLFGIYYIEDIDDIPIYVFLN